MKKMLRKQKCEVYYYKNNKKVIGIHSGLTGDISAGLRGNISGLRGNISGLTGDISAGLRGDISGLTGDISGLRGDISGLTGDIDLCEITETERKKGIRIEELIMETNEEK